MEGTFLIFHVGLYEQNKKRGKNGVNGSVFFTFVLAWRLIHFIN